MTHTSDRFGWLRSLIYLFMFFVMLSAFARAQTAGATMPWVRPQFLDNTGLPLAGGKVCTYLAGTSTPQATYQDSALGTPNANPVVLDASGRPINGINPVNIFLSGVNYKFVLYSAGTDPLLCPGGGTLIWTQDNIGDIGQILKVNLATPGVSTGAALVAFQQTGAGTVTQTVQAKLQQYPAVADYSGANFGVKFAACAAALPATGGVCDARMLSGQQSIVSDVFAAIVKPTTLLLSCATELDLTHAQTITSGQISILSDCQNPSFGPGQAPQAAGARIKATAALAAPMFYVNGSAAGISGVNFGNLTFDCNSNATWAIVADSLQGSVWPGGRTYQNCTTGGLKLEVTGVTAAIGTQRNNFGDSFFENVPNCLWLGGNDESAGPNNANTNNNTFGLSNCDFTGVALMCHNADSNYFSHWVNYRASGVGLGVDLGGPASQDCRDNYWASLDASPGGLTQRAGNNGFNVVGLYIAENGAPEPTVVGNGRLDILDNGAGAREPSFIGGTYHKYALNRDWNGADIPKCFNATFAGSGTCGGDTNYIQYNSSAPSMDYVSTSLHRFFGDIVSDNALTNSILHKVVAKTAVDQAFVTFGSAATSDREFDLGRQIDASFGLFASGVVLYETHDYGVGTLPACSGANKGALVHVVDALAPAWGANVAGGGAVFALVTCNGANWTVIGK